MRFSAATSYRFLFIPIKSLGIVFMAEPASPPAMIDREPRQAWKGAAAAVDSGAGVWLAGDAAISLTGPVGLNKRRPK